MAGWRDEATAVHTAALKRMREKTLADRLATTPDEPTVPEFAFARRVLEEVLTPVLREFATIVTGVPGQTVCHRHGTWAVGLTCDLDSHRFTVELFLQPDGKVRIAVSLTPSETLGWNQDFRPDVSNEEIEEWFGSALVRLYRTI